MSAEPTIVTGGTDYARRLVADGIQGDFEREVSVLLGYRIITSDDDAAALWSALTNIIWTDQGGGEIGYSYRSAGDLICAIRGEGTYIDWYCCASDGVVAIWISEGLAAFGWRWESAKV